LKDLLLKMKADPEEILFYNESGIDIPVHLQDITNITQLVFSEEKTEWESLEFVFLDEKGIIDINTLHLNRDYVTDVITYHYQNEDEPVEGTIYLCAQRIKEQSEEFKTNETDEFNRIIIHALLHLCGYDDDSPNGKALMTNKENYYLSRI